MLASSSDDLRTIYRKVSFFIALGLVSSTSGGDIGGTPSEPTALYTSSFGFSGSSSFFVSSRIALRTLSNDR